MSDSGSAIYLPGLVSIPVNLFDLVRWNAAGGLTAVVLTRRLAARPARWFVIGAGLWAIAVMDKVMLALLGRGCAMNKLNSPP